MWAVKQGAVFTLQSIKSRIETIYSAEKKLNYWKFLLYSPLNQGLKHFQTDESVC